MNAYKTWFGNHPSRQNLFARSAPLAWLLLFAVLSMGAAWSGWRGNASHAPVATVQPRISATSAKSPSFTYKPIESIGIGEWVIADNPEVLERDLSGDFDGLDAEVSRKLTLKLIKPSGGELRVELIRHEFWIEYFEVSEGAEIHLDMPELGISGMAEVLAVEPCPIPAPRPSSRHYLVTGAFAHSSSNTIDLQVEGVQELIRCTDNHPFWCVELQRFVPAGELAIGQHLEAVDGAPKRISGLARRSIAEPVYNLEVDHQHVYFVSSVGLLAHNTYTTKAMREAANATDAGGWKYFRDPFTNLWKATREKLSPDHIFPAKYIEEMAEAAGLSKKQLRELLKDPKNLTPLTESLNKSKSDRLAHEIEEMLGEKVSQKWKDWLARRQKSLKKYFEEEIKKIAEANAKAGT